jgi:hypothetical protein
MNKLLDLCLSDIIQSLSSELPFFATNCTNFHQFCRFAPYHLFIRGNS